MLSSFARALHLSALPLTALMLLPSPAHAHDPGLSSLTIQLRSDRSDAILRLGNEDAARAGLVPGSAPAGISAPIRFTPTLTRPPDRAPEIRADDDGVVVIWRLSAARGAAISVQPVLLERLGPGHKQLVRVLGPDGRPLASRIVDVGAPEWTLPLDGLRTPATEGAWSRIAAYARLGAVHVAEGLDHAAFLLAVLLGCHGLRPVLASVTVFTAAHSITLALALFGFVALPPAIVEITIAASIVFVAARNLAPGVGSGERVAVIFAFGLVHGLGFAGQLGELGAGSGTEATTALVGFNLGIELAQVAAVAAVFPVLTLLGRAPRWRRATVRTGSAALGASGLLWLVERALALG